MREQSKQGSGIVDAAAFLYAEDAPLALQVAEAQIRAEETERVARTESGTTAALLEAEAAAQRELAATLARSSRIVDDPATAPDLTADDLMERLAELRQRSELSEIDPTASQVAANDLNYKSSLLLVALIPLAVAFMFGALAQVYPERRTALLVPGAALAVAAAIFAVVVEVTL